MKDVKFKKKCNPIDLHSELVEAGFQFHGVTCEDDITIVHLKDVEIKDPTPVVEAHVYVPIDQKTAVRVLRHMIAGMPEWISNLKVLAQGLGVDVEKIPDPPLEQTPEEIITEWIKIELLNLKKFNAMLEKLGEPHHTLKIKET